MAGNQWAWADIKDTKEGKTMRMKAWGKQSKLIAELTFLRTYEFHGFECKESHVDGKLECGWRHKAAIQAADEQLDEEDTWDTKVYGPLTDIAPGQTSTNNLDFIVKLMRIGDQHGEMVSVDFKDEEGTSKPFNVDETLRDQLLEDRVYVIHRAKIIDNQGSLDTWAMLSTAPSSYVW